MCPLNDLQIPFNVHAGMLNKQLQTMKQLNGLMTLFAYRF